MVANQNSGSGCVSSRSDTERCSANREILNVRVMPFLGRTWPRTTASWSSPTWFIIRQVNRPTSLHNGVAMGWRGAGSRASDLWDAGGRRVRVQRLPRRVTVGCGIVAMIAAFLAVGSIPVLAHPSGLNSSGCHNSRKTGDYHCHRSQASSRSPTPPSPTPPAHTKLPIKRSAAAKAEFRRANASPATSSSRTFAPSCCSAAAA